MAKNPGTIKGDIFVMPPNLMKAVLAVLIVIAIILTALAGVYFYNTPAVQKLIENRAKAKELAKQQIEVNRANAALALKRKAEAKAREVGTKWGKNQQWLKSNGEVSSVNGETIEGYLAGRMGENGKPIEVIDGVKRFLDAKYPDRWWVFRIQFKETWIPYPVVVVREADGTFRELTGEDIASQIKNP